MSLECKGCYADPKDGHLFDCPTRIRQLEKQNDAMKEALEACLQALRHAPIEGCYGKDARYKAEEVLRQVNL